MTATDSTGDRWQSLADVPHDVIVVDKAGDHWRHNGNRGWMWSHPKETGWSTPFALSNFRTAYAPYRRA